MFDFDRPSVMRPDERDQDAERRDGLDPHRASESCSHSGVQDLEGILERAQKLGIAPWRVLVALGLDPEH